MRMSHGIAAAVLALAAVGPAVAADQPEVTVTDRHIPGIDSTLKLRFPSFEGIFRRLGFRKGPHRADVVEFMTVRRHRERQQRIARQTEQVRQQD
jgi:hypothetical protein